MEHFESWFPCAVNNIRSIIKKHECPNFVTDPLDYCFECWKNDFPDKDNWPVGEFGHWKKFGETAECSCCLNFQLKGAQKFWALLLISFLQSKLYNLIQWKRFTLKLRPQLRFGSAIRPKSSCSQIKFSNKSNYFFVLPLLRGFPYSSPNQLKNLGNI